MAKKILSFFKNKYVFTTLGLVIWILFFDKNDIFSQLELRSKLKDLEGEKKYYINEIKNIKDQNVHILNDVKDIEKYARENYFMKRDSEDVFVIVRDTAENKPKF